MSSGNGLKARQKEAHGGHTWPQGTGPNYPNVVGLRSMDMNATGVIWEFFKRHKRN